MQAIFAKCNVLPTSIGRPRMTDKCRIVQKIIKWDGPTVNIRNLSKDLRNMTTEVVKGIPNLMYVHVCIWDLYNAFIRHNTFHFTLCMILEELRKLVEDGYGIIVTKEQLHKDKVLPFNQCCNLYLKPEPTGLDAKFFKMAKDRDMNFTTYSAFWNQATTDQMKKIVMKYHPQRENIAFSQVVDTDSSKYR